MGLSRRRPAATKIHVPAKPKRDNRSKAVSTPVTDDASWQSVLDGVLCRFSVGGRYVRRFAKVVNGKVVTKYTDQHVELSLVDRPALPSAKITEIRKLAHESRDDRLALVIREATLEGIAQVMKGDHTGHAFRGNQHVEHCHGARVKKLKVRAP